MSTAAAAWSLMTIGGAVTGQAAAETLAAGSLEEEWHVVVGHLVKMVEVYRSAGHSWLTVNSPKARES